MTWARIGAIDIRAEISSATSRVSITNSNADIFGLIAPEHLHLLSYGTPDSGVFKYDDIYRFSKPRVLPFLGRTFLSVHSSSTSGLARVKA